MARYNDPKHFKKSNSAEFGKSYKPGETPVEAGIYKCTGCGFEIASNQDVQLPTQNHSQHRPVQGPIRWKLICATN